MLKGKVSKHQRRVLQILCSSGAVDLPSKFNDHQHDKRRKCRGRNK